MRQLQRKSGRVISTRGGLARVQVKRSGSCAACSCSGFCTPLGKEWMVFEAINQPGAEAGQEVIVAYETESELKASFILYIIPLLGLLAGAVAGAWMDPLGNQDLSSAAAGFGLMIAAFVLIRVYSRKRYAGPKGFSPVVEEILPAE